MSSSTLERGTRTAERGRPEPATRSRAAGTTTGTTSGRGASTTRGGSRATASRARARVEEVADASGGTAPFVLLIMVLLTTGLVATLWLSTAAAADSYRLDSARQATRDRSEEVERLHRDVAAMQSAPALAAAAERIGMVPAGVPAVILVHPDGSSQVVGTPAKARAAAPPPSPAAASAPGTPGAAAGSPDPEALANDPRSGVQASTGGVLAPAPAGAAATGTAPASSPGPVTSPAASPTPAPAASPTPAPTPKPKPGPTTPATPGGR
ncbi:hypothetical protein LQ327_24135 [Actinomycetospora endophytica]|uniref:Cell division protein FtsL n=1 Tax=Actinomycetospora endophytica TaxID=2291215 RepID=A0ABS8PEQ8_9PSEU|nr:hypothetical protein [Actinomycetospora endophytica]MCD2196468.1 hypothetical protein [Actinomycetospora endophytica]